MSDTSSANASKISGLSNASFQKYCSGYLDSHPDLSVREIKSRIGKGYELASLSNGTLLVSDKNGFSETTVREWNNKARKPRAPSFRRSEDPSEAPSMSMASTAPPISV